MKASFFVVLLTMVFAVDSLAQINSIYTSTKTSACRTITSTSEGTGSYVGECAGVGGYKIQVLEGDIRQTINIITPGRAKKFELNLWGFYGSFSSLGEKVEWRTRRGVPVALIVRYNVADPEGGKPSTSYLVVSKVGRASSCVTKFVLPGPTQNGEARKLADAAATKPCIEPE